MLEYEVLPRNPEFGTRVIDADGYEWGPKRVMFWQEDEADPSVTMRQTVAEFAVDWVAGVVVGKDE